MKKQLSVLTLSLSLLFSTLAFVNSSNQVKANQVDYSNTDFKVKEYQYFNRVQNGEEFTINTDTGEPGNFAPQHSSDPNEHIISQNSDLNYVHSGSYSMKLNLKYAARSNPDYVKFDVSVEANKTYLFSYWAYISSCDDDFSFSTLALGGVKVNEWTTSIGRSLKNKWVNVTKEFVAPKTEYLDLYFKTYQGDGTVYLDDITLFEVPTYTNPLGDCHDCAKYIRGTQVTENKFNTLEGNLSSNVITFEGNNVSKKFKTIPFSMCNSEVITTSFLGKGDGAKVVVKILDGQDTLLTSSEIPFDNNFKSYFTLNSKVIDKQTHETFEVEVEVTLGEESTLELSFLDVCEHDHNLSTNSTKVGTGCEYSVTETCNDCFYQNIYSEERHTYYVDKQATCKSNGRLRCSVCDKTQVIPAKAHTFATEVRCGQGGSQECTSCHQLISIPGEHNYKCESIDSLNHQETCSFCNETHSESHSFKYSIVNDPTFLDEGDCIATCDKCEHKEAFAINPLATNDWTKVDVIPATCETAGTAIYVSKYGETKEVSVAPLGHSYERVSKAPTCTEYGLHDYFKCVRCDKIKDDKTLDDIEKIDPLGHQFGDWFIEVAPTTSSTGIYKRICKRDATHVESVVMPILNDTHYDVEILVVPTSDKEGLTSYSSKDFPTIYVTTPKDTSTKDRVRVIVVCAAIFVVVSLSFVTFFTIKTKKDLKDFNL